MQLKVNFEAGLKLKQNRLKVKLIVELNVEFKTVSKINLNMNNLKDSISRPDKVSTVEVAAVGVAIVALSLFLIRLFWGF